MTKAKLRKLQSHSGAMLYGHSSHIPKKNSMSFFGKLGIKNGFTNSWLHYAKSYLGELYEGRKE